MYSSHRLSGRILLSLLLYTQQSNCPAKQLPLTFSPQVTAQAIIPMLDQGKGLIHLDVSVTNSVGEPVSDLSREDFELLDQNLPQRILSFRAFHGQSAEPGPPVQVILFFDTLCKIYEPTPCLRESDAMRAQGEIEAFVRQDNGRLSQPVSIFGISDDGLWTIPHHDSQDGHSLASDLASGKRIFLNQRPEALRALGFIANTERRKRGRKVLLWIGPGCGEGTGIFPTSSSEGQKTFDPIYWFTTLFREARMSIDELPVDEAGPCAPGYELYLDMPKTVHEANDRFLYKKVLAIQSGGRVTHDSRDLVADINRSIKRASNFYSLSFDPPAAAQTHEYHSLQVRIEKAGLIAHTNTGYYDEPFYSDQPSPADQHVTVEQLGLLLSQTDDRGIDVRAERLKNLELSERLSLANLYTLTADPRNRRVQQALVGMADLSAFLGPPPVENPKQANPEADAKQHMLALVKSYLETTVSKLPDFYAMRTTTRYEQVPNKSSAGNQPMHVVEMSKARILYRDGDEVLESPNSDQNDSSGMRLITRGTFGPILAEVLRAVATPGRMQWIRWETGPEGRRGVFGFEVSAADSKYFEGGCCLPDADGEDSFRTQAGYRGEIAIHPEDGTIFRLQLQFNIQEFVPMDRDAVLIDYGPVKIGGKTYICPLRSVSLARGRSTTWLKQWDQSFRTYGPYSTKMNDMRFTDYHVFRAASRLLPGFTPGK